MSEKRRRERSLPERIPWRRAGINCLRSLELHQAEREGHLFRVGRHRQRGGTTPAAHEPRRIANLRRDLQTWYEAVHSRGDSAEGCSRAWSLPAVSDAARRRREAGSVSLALHDGILGHLEVSGAGAAAPGRPAASREISRYSVEEKHDAVPNAHACGTRRGNLCDAASGPSFARQLRSLEVDDDGGDGQGTAFA